MPLSQWSFWGGLTWKIFPVMFLSSVMTQDYKNALKHCLTILKYEPNNKTAQEFYPLLEKKLKLEVERRECRYSWEADDDEYSTVSEDSSDHFSSAKSGDSDSFMSSDQDSEEITGMSSEKGCNEVIKKSDVGEKNIFSHNIE
ncbi:uncharacterized protein LOC143225168 isoform X2 [Tachypleus tridentatus]|uniref:uncharacterized protein LOC143225168 isoform X2 n=1 Tax=Tachypleus tridentatus TaxID=6853 RepID=UPI003FD14A6B